MVSNHERLINSAIRRKDIVTVNEYMVPYPVTETVYYCPRPNNLDRLHGKYYPRAILDHVEYSLKDKWELSVMFLWSREWRVIGLGCRGAKKCRVESCKSAQVWHPPSRRTKYCLGCKRKCTMDLVPCNTRFYYLEECEAEEPAQILFCVQDHSHEKVAPFKVRKWVSNEIERIALSSALQPRDIHAGRGSETATGAKINLMVHCPALANLDRISAIMRQARRRASTLGSNKSEFGPGDAYNVTSAMLLQYNSTNLEQGKSASEGRSVWVLVFHSYTDSYHSL